MTNFPKREAALELARLAADLPDARWLALITSNGSPVAVFPDFTADQDRITAMGSAMLSLGERISRELQGGEFRYALIGGSLANQLVCALDGKILLVAGLRPGASLDAVLAGLGRSIEPLLRIFKIASCPAWLAAQAR
jgi:predicted regulator of Ras-like GTPase activity (Roadblock/LC7/MglB family)